MRELRTQARRVIRYSQVHIPGGSDAKYRAQRIWRTARRRPFEHHFAALAQLGLPIDRPVLDIGGNRGQSVDAIRLVLGSHVPVVSVEPNPWLAESIRRLNRTDKGLEVRSCALGSQQGTCTLHVPFYRGYMFDGLASLDPDDAPAWLARHMAFYDPAKLTMRRVDAPLTTVDDLGLTPSFMKLDVQGWELEVLRGSHRTLRECRPVLLVETPSSELTAMIREFGYEPHGYRNGEFIAGPSSDSNTFFLATRYA